jgi:lipoprotein-anchoring transpeptidase ErfK/SrfK
MRKPTQIAFVSALLPALLLIAGPSAQAQSKTGNVTEVRRLVVSLPDRRMALLENGQVKRIYVVAVGKKSTPSPTGTFTIITRVANPSYSHDGKIVAPGAGNPVGTRWMGLSTKGYGIHGTNAPSSIGKAASHGCIRMRKSDLEELFAQMKTGDQVEIVGQRDAETAEVFGNTDNPSAGATVQIAVADEPAPAPTKTAQTAAATRSGE